MVFLLVLVARPMVSVCRWPSTKRFISFLNSSRYCSSGLIHIGLARSWVILSLLLMYFVYGCKIQSEDDASRVGTVA